MARLSDATLRALPEGIHRPGYDRTGTTVAIVHLGIGAFHRAHFAAYVDACLADDPGWAICGVSLRSPRTRDALAPQDGLYTLGVQSEAGLEPRIIGSVREVLVAPEQPGALLDRLADPATRIVSLTVTEKGYCHDPATGRLKSDHPDIVHDLAADAATADQPPVSAIGWLWLGLMARHRRGVPPYTILCCDNLPSNGATVRQVLLDYVALKDPDQAVWAAENLAFPSTMVDRIVPATTDHDRAMIAAALGAEDAWPVMTEPFSQFVVEDWFPQGRPKLERHGVTLTGNVEPFENMKLRMLNGSHSALAYLGYLAGHETVAQTMADASLRRLIGAMMTSEIIPTLSMPGDVDLPAYHDGLLRRFANPALQHRTYQIAMDGSQKLPQRLLGTIRDRLSIGEPIDRLALAVAAWIRFATGRDETGAAFTVQDPMAERFAALALPAAIEKDQPGRFDAEALATGFLGLTAVFGKDLPEDDRFHEAVVRALKMLCEQGSRATIAAYAKLGASQLEDTEV